MSELKKLIVVLCLVLVGCNKKQNTVVAALTPPQLLHVSNGSDIGYYTVDGDFAVTDEFDSIFTLPNGADAQTVQLLSDGTFIFGSDCVGCNFVTLFKGYSAGYKFISFNESQRSITTGGVAEGLALDSTNFVLYAGDSVNKTVTFLNPATGYPKIGGTVAASTFDYSVEAAVGGLQYLAVDTIERRLVFTDPTNVKVFFADASDGSFLNTLPNGLSLSSASCANLSYPFVVSSLHKAYVLCDDVIVYVTTTNVPDFSLGNLGASTFSLTGMNTAKDLVYLATQNALYIVGDGSRIVKMNPTTGAIVTTFDITAACGVTDLSAIVYSADTNLLYVADKTNSRIYKIKPSNLQLNDSTCAGSRFSVSDVSQPTRLTYF